LEIDSPALLTTRSTPPKASAASRNVAATVSASLTSAATPMATSVPPISAAAPKVLLTSSRARTTVPGAVGVGGSSTVTAFVCETLHCGCGVDHSDGG
jgi:hypothetical protein